MIALPHRIRRLRWRVRTRTADEAFAVRSALRETMEAAVLAELERMFDEMVAEHGTVHIDRLELKLEALDAGHILTSLPDLVHGSTSRFFESELEREVSAESDAASWRRVDEPARRLAALMHYLETGNLTWDFAVEDRVAVTRALAETVQRDRAAIVERAKRQVGSAPALHAFFFRLLQLLPTELWVDLAKRIIESLSPDIGPGLIEAVVSVRETVEGGAPGYPALHGVALLFAAARAGSNDDRRRLLISALGAKGAPREPAYVLPRCDALPEVAAAFVTRWLTHVPPGDETQQSPPEFTRPRVQPQTPGVRIGDEQIAAPRRPRRAGEVGPRPASADAPSDRLAEPDEAGLLVHHAGLVLVHPFLPRLMDAVGISGADGTLGRGVLPRAASLLHFLATGVDEVWEFDAAFVKVLLGLQPQAQLPISSGLLSDEDLEEADALLRAVVEHWRVLKNTSIEVLRESFLQRPGLLHEDEQGWHLQVESRTHDVLLDHLPWSIGVAKLPWVSKPIFTDWTSY